MPLPIEVFFNHIFDRESDHDWYNPLFGRRNLESRRRSIKGFSVNNGARSKNIITDP